jgi:hypothetical protein
MFGWNCLILLQEWINIVKPKISKDILNMRRLLEVENIRCKAVLRKIDSLFCNFINSKRNPEHLYILRIA